MNNISMALCLLSMGFCLGCCPDEETPGLPPVTSEGKNTFACKINGEVFVADGSGTDTPNAGIYAIIETDFDTLGNFLPRDSSDFWLIADNGKQIVSFFINSPLSVGKHNFSSNTATYPTVVKPKNYGEVSRSGKDFITTSVDTGSLFITRCDRTKFIISGTFQFKAKNLSNKAETVEVTEGRFDLDYSKTH